MNNKIISGVVIIVLLSGIFTVFITAVNAEGLNLLCLNKQKLTVILKNDADINTSKDKISKIPQVKITNIKYRDEEWSRMVNKMDLPRMENPFKNEFTVKVSKKADINEICSKIKEMDFVEDVKDASDKK